MVKYFIGGKTHYIINGVSLTEAEVETMHEKDRRQGYEDRKNHCYDKWYRYNHADNGKAYDEGVAKCVNEKHSTKWYRDDETEFRLIECLH